MKRSALFLHAAVVVALLACPAGALAGIGPHYVASDNVEHLQTIPFDVGQTAGGAVVGDKLFVTSAKNLSIYDISNPEKPELAGLLKANLAWENEEVPTNGKILAISNDWFDLMPSCTQGTELNVTSCLQLFDVRDPANIKELPAVPQNGDHTSTCVLDCSYLYGSGGSITDLRGVLDGADPQDLGDWRPAAGSPRSCHHVRELEPGILFAACRPYIVMSVNAEDGGSITKPVVLARSSPADVDDWIVHSVRWPRDGRDRFALRGGETNFNAQCDDSLSTLAVLDASDVDETGQFSAPIDEIRPYNGTYVDGNMPANATGCSVHWFQEHPSFKNGGLVALASYDNGVRFLQVTREGQLVEQGYFQPLGAETSSPKWVPGTDIVYSIDYARGIDVLRWTGEHYVPEKGKKPKHEKGREPGTEGEPAPPLVATRAQRARVARTDAKLQASGWSRSLCLLAARRAG
jgi:hypothetical protein